MPGIISDLQANAVVDALFGASSATYYLAIMKTTPAGDGSGGTEVTGGSYARVAFTDNATTWPAAASRLKRNGIVFTFPVPTADWCTDAWGLGIYTAAALGTPKGFFAFTVPVTILNGYPAFVIPINSITARALNSV